MNFFVCSCKKLQKKNAKKKCKVAKSRQKNNVKGFFLVDFVAFLQGCSKGGLFFLIRILRSTFVIWTF
mgnify:CR=1 FL=1